MEIMIGREREGRLENGHVCALISTISNKIEAISEMKKTIKANQNGRCVWKGRRENTLKKKNATRKLIRYGQTWNNAEVINYLIETYDRI